MLEVGEPTLETDKEGYLKNLADWDENVAVEIARAENISLSPAHWEIIRSLHSRCETRKRVLHFHKKT